MEIFQRRTDSFALTAEKAALAYTTTGIIFDRLMSFRYVVAATNGAALGSMGPGHSEARGASRGNVTVNAADVAEALEGRREGAGYRCRCPVHGGKSLKVQDASHRDNPLVWCFGGCDFRDVAKALRGMGLWEDDRPVSTEDALVRRQERELRKARRIVQRFDELQRCDTPLFDSDYREWDLARAILWMHGEDEHPYRKQIREALGDA